jgi:hypothetical protein
MIDIDPNDIPALLLGYIVITLGSGFIYSEIWRIRGSKRKFIVTFDTMLKETEVGKALINISQKVTMVETEVEKVKSTLEKLDLEKLPTSIRDSVRGMLGGLAKSQNHEIRKIEGELAEVVAVEYPGLTWVMENNDLLVDLGLISSEWGAKVTRMAQHPTLLPVLEKTANTIRLKFENTDGQQRNQGGKFKW